MPGFTFRQLTSRPLADGRCRVFLDVAWSEQKKKLRTKLPTGVRTLPVHFNAAAKPGKIISTRDPNSSALNERLTSLLSDVQKTFTLAETLGQSVAPEQLLALANKEEAAAAAAAEVAPSSEPTFAQLYQLWKDEHPHSTPDALRRYKQVVDHLERFHPGIRLAQVTRAVFIKYISYLQGVGLSDTTVVQHVRFLRNCHRVTETHVPSWMTMRVRFGRAVTLLQEELAALRRVELDPVKQGYLIRERERIMFQTLMLVRDSDLRRIQPHHVVAEQWQGFGSLLVLSFHQKKTGDQVRFPLPPMAASIWQQWEGKVPIITQQKRNEYMKELAKLAGLKRTFVRVRFKKGVPVEEPLPLWSVISTHTPRHTGADMVLWGSFGDQNLKEVALGHLAGGSVYGYDTITRYGPLLLQAWARVGAMAENAPTSEPVAPGVVGKCLAPPMAVKPVLTRFVG
jgi:hypothetical protein